MIIPPQNQFLYSFFQISQRHHHSSNLSTQKQDSLSFTCYFPHQQHIIYPVHTSSQVSQALILISITRDLVQDTIIPYCESSATNFPAPSISLFSCSSYSLQLLLISYRIKTSFFIMAYKLDRQFPTCLTSSHISLLHIHCGLVTLDFFLQLL